MKFAVCNEVFKDKSIAEAFDKIDADRSIELAQAVVDFVGERLG